MLNNNCSKGPRRNLLLDELESNAKYRGMTAQQRQAKADALEKSFCEFVAGGKGLVAIHGAPTMLNNSPRFTGMIGAAFDYHPPNQAAHPRRGLRRPTRNPRSLVPPCFSAVSLFVALAALAIPATCPGGETVLVEAEQFADFGGWVNDCQFMDQMGSPFLLAHGLGEPVKDATTEVALPAAGTYRCLYSRNVPNLFMAGRDISVTHEALGTVRVMRTGGCMGEIVGMAASLCKQHDTEPRRVYENHLDDLKELMRQGVGKPPVVAGLEPPKWLAAAGDNLARVAKVSVSGSRDEAQNPPARLNDGRIDLADNTGRWLSEARVPHWVEFRWEKPQGISAARVVSGYAQGGDVIEPITSFVLQVPDGETWRDVPGTRTAGNMKVDWYARFDPVTTDRLRLMVSETSIDISRVWEVELYNAPK